MAYVKVYTGMTPSICKCGNWLMHFHNHSNQWIIWCSEVSCERIAKVGSVVQLTNNNDESLYVIPLCNRHANSKYKLNIGEVKPIKTSLSCFLKFLN